MAQYVRDGGVWKQVQRTFVRDGGVWKSVKAGYVRHNSTWKAMFAPLGLIMDDDGVDVGSFESWPNGTSSPPRGMSVYNAQSYSYTVRTTNSTHGSYGLRFYNVEDGNGMYPLKTTHLQFDRQIDFSLYSELTFDVTAKTGHSSCVLSVGLDIGGSLGNTQEYDSTGSYTFDLGSITGSGHIVVWGNLEYPAKDKHIDICCDNFRLG